MGNFASKLVLCSLFAVLSLPSTGCKSRSNNESIVNDLRDPRRDGNDPDWIYNGPLPKLEAPIKINVSIRSHTARVVGFIPASVDVATLLKNAPHAHVDNIGGRNRLTVVYPVATVNPGLNPRGNSLGEKKGVSIFPYNPFGLGSHADTPWGGFPYIEYDNDRSIAFHGPITRFDGFWRLLRGPVSNACNRMQGEHVTELAHLLGIDMTVPHSTSFSVRNNNVTVNVFNNFDRIADGSLAGKLADVDYKAEPGVMRPPAAEAKIFKTWSGLEHPDWVCMFRKERKNLGMEQCSDLKPGGSGGASPVVVGQANAHICNTEKVNVRNNRLEIFSSAVLNEPVKRLGKRQEKDGNTFEEVFFTTPPVGNGFVAIQFLCDGVK